MFDLFRDSAWGAVDALGGVLLGIVGILLTIRYFKKSNKKSLSYRVVSMNNIVRDLQEINKEELKIYFNNHLVENLSILNIEFVNNGYVSISKNDFEEDLQIKFDKNSRIFQTLINNVYPGNLNPEFNILNENSVVIKPLLLNSGDRFTTSIVITEYKFINISARILGISKLMEIASTFTNYDTSFSGRFWGLISDYKKEIVEIAFLGIGGFSLALISGKLAFSALGVILIYILYFIIDKITAFSKSDR